MILECAVTRRYAVNPENFRERIFFEYLMYDDPFLWTSDISARYAPKAVGLPVVGMKSTLGGNARRNLVEHIIKDKQRAKVLKNIIKSMSPGELREKGMDNDLSSLPESAVYRWKTYQTPTRIIHGTHDADVPLDHAEWAARKIGNAQLTVVQGGFHVMALTDEIDEISANRLDFLKAHASKKKGRTLLGGK